LKRIHFGRLIATNAFTTDEPEYAMLDKWVSPGDWVVDIGANVGHYTYRLSSLVGATGRVLAFEPVPDSFALLTATAQRCAHANVTLINAAASDCTGVAGMSIPTRTNGLSDYYQAHLIASRGGGLSVLTMPLDTMCQGHRIALVKIDVEGHEASVVSGMSRLIEASRPVLIVETGSPEVIDRLVAMGYTAERLPGSPNVLFLPRVRDATAHITRRWPRSAGR
jgi:FkbM family methyltransferase